MAQMRGQVRPVRWDGWMVKLVSADLTGCLLSHVAMTKLGTARGISQYRLPNSSQYHMYGPKGLVGHSWCNNTIQWLKHPARPMTKK